MSVQVLDTNIYNAILRRVDSYKFHKVCDIDYSELLKLEENDAIKFVQTLLELNVKSYISRYYDVQANYIIDYRVERINVKKCSAVQLLKWLIAIRYNIELCTIEEKGFFEITDFEKESMKLLSMAIDELQGIIISNLVPEYETAQWSSFDDSLLN